MQFASKTGVCGMDRYCQALSWILNTLNLTHICNAPFDDFRMGMADRAKRRLPMMNIGDVWEGCILTFENLQ